MLTAMRDGAHSKVIKMVLFSLLILASLGLVLMDVGGFFRTGGVGTTVVARAGKDKIGMMEFDNTVRRTLQQQGLSPQQAYQFGMVDSILQQQISTSLMTRAAFDMGFYPGDEEVARQINSMLDPVAKQQANVTRKEILQRFLQSQGISEHEFIMSIRHGIMTSLLQATVQAPVALPSKQEAAAIYAYRNESRAVEGILLLNSSVKDIEKAPDDILKALYEAAKGLKYSIPETRSFTIAILSDATVRSGLTIPDEDLKAEYDSNISIYTTPERRVVQQAVLKDEAAAQKTLEAVKAGQSLKQAAGKDYQGEQTYEKSGLSTEIAESAFNAEVNDAIGPFKSPLGWSVLVVRKTLPSEVQPFDSVKDAIRKQITADKMAGQMFDTANTIDDRLAGGEDLETVAKDMGLILEKISSSREDGSTPDQHDAMKAFDADRADILKSAFELNEGESAPVMELKDGRYATVRVDSITPTSYRPFEDVREELRKQWASDQQASANRTRAQKIQQDIAAGTTSLSDAARELGLSVQGFSTIKRTGEAPKTLGDESLPALFSAAEGESVVAPIPGGLFVGRIKTITLPDPATATDKDLKDITDSLIKSAREEWLLAYMQVLEKKMGIKINRNLLDQMYGPEGNPG